MNLLERIGIENGKKMLPTVRVGDTVRVHYLIREGEKERVQPFTGTVIAIRGRSIAKSLIVRRLVQGEGVERIFPFHSPRVRDIEVTRRGKVRRAKLYFLRDRVGKQTRVDELLGERARRLAAPTPSVGAEESADAPAEDPSEPVQV
jgi:large subunit ribosomal protein L19